MFMLLVISRATSRRSKTSRSPPSLQDHQRFVGVVSEPPLVLLENALNLGHVLRMDSLHVFVAWVGVQRRGDRFAVHNAERFLLRQLLWHPQEASPEQDDRDLQRLAEERDDIFRRIPDTGDTHTHTQERYRGQRLYR